MEQSPLLCILWTQKKAALCYWNKHRWRGTTLAGQTKEGQKPFTGHMHIMFY